MSHVWAAICDNHVDDSLIVFAKWKAVHDCLTMVHNVGRHQCRAVSWRIRSPAAIIAAGSNTSLTVFHYVNASNPSIRNPATKHFNSACVLLCDTVVCLLHIHEIGTNALLPNMHRTPCRGFAFFDLLQNQHLETKNASWSNPFFFLQDRQSFYRVLCSIL